MRINLDPTVAEINPPSVSTTLAVLVGSALTTAERSFHTVYWASAL